MKHVLLFQKEMLTQLQSLLSHMLTKSDIPEDIKMGTEIDFGIKV